MLTKSEVLNEVAGPTGLKRKEVQGVLDAVTGLVTKELKKTGKIKLQGLGIFVKKHRLARMARNPKTGEMIKVKAKTVVRFRVAKTLKEAVL